MRKKGETSLLYKVLLSCWTEVTENLNVSGAHQKDWPRACQRSERSGVSGGEGSVL